MFLKIHNYVYIIQNSIMRSQIIIFAMLDIFTWKRISIYRSKKIM